MNIFRVSHKDIKVLLFIRPPFMILLCYVLFGRSFFTESSVFFPALTAGVVTVLVTWWFHIYADHFLRKRFIDTNHTVRRLFLSIIFHFGIAAMFIACLFLLADAWNFLGYRFSWPSLLSGLLVALCTNLAATGFHEGVYMLENWKRTLIEAEELKKLTLSSRLAGLRNQTSPHFFFNSINTLAGLIEIDTDKADRFLNEMCIVYRYLLKNEPDAFVPLDSELNFIRSWIYLVQTRYSNTIRFILNEPASAPNTCIPRLTLLFFLESILNTHDISDNFTVSMEIKHDVITITHPAYKRKTKNPEGPSRQENEVRSIYRLLGLPEIRETVGHRNRHIEIPLYLQDKNTAAHEPA